MIRILLALAAFLGAAPQMAAAQQGGVYVQIEAKPTIAEARQAIRQYETYLQDVNGFSLNTGYYAIALGPYSREDAGQVLRVLRGEGRIPGDSYIASPSWYNGQFWPPENRSGTPPANGAVSSGVMQSPIQSRPLPDAAPAAPAAPTPAAQAPNVQAPNVQAPAPSAPSSSNQALLGNGSDSFDTGGGLPDETPAEARRSEAQLTRAQRDQLQRALQWAGYYDGAIDGAIGPGSRRAMQSWQQANGYDATGVMTTAQRAALIRDYNAILSGMELRQVNDDAAGVSVLMPTALVKYSRTQSPFAYYEPAGGDQAPRVLLISQPGDRLDFQALYEILQTMPFVPQDGPRSRRGDSFTIEGHDSSILSFTQASLQNGQIKGFTLIWPANDKARFERLLAEMQNSFRSLPGVLPRKGEDSGGKAIDLVSGLQLSKPAMSRSGVFVDGAGSVITVSGAVAQCSRVTLNGDIPAKVVANDNGLALLRPTRGITPRAFASVAPVAPGSGGDIAVAGYSYQGLLGAPTLSFGKMAGTGGLNGEAGENRLSVRLHQGDAGGAVLDMQGQLVGIVKPLNDSGTRQLPGNVAFASDTASIESLMRNAGVQETRGTSAASPLPAETLSRMARNMAVLVNCWN